MVDVPFEVDDLSGRPGAYDIVFSASRLCDRARLFVEPIVDLPHVLPGITADGRGYLVVGAGVNLYILTGRSLSLADPSATTTPSIGSPEKQCRQPWP